MNDADRRAIEALRAAVFADERLLDRCLAADDETAFDAVVRDIARALAIALGPETIAEALVEARRAHLERWLR